MLKERLVWLGFDDRPGFDFLAARRVVGSCVFYAEDGEKSVLWSMLHAVRHPEVETGLCRMSGLCLLSTSSSCQRLPLLSGVPWKFSWHRRLDATQTT